MKESSSHSPVYVHFLRRLCGFVICNFGRHSHHDDEGYDPTGNIDRRVGLVHARIVGITGRDGGRRECLHPPRRTVILAHFLIQPVFLVLAAEAQVARPAAVPVLRVVALEHFVILPADVVVAQAGVVVAGGRRFGGLLRDDRGDSGGFGRLLDWLLGFFTTRCGTQDAQGVQVDEQQ